MTDTSPIAIARTFLETLTRPGFFSDLYGPEFMGWAEAMDENAIVLFPYAPPGMPTRCEGRENWLASIRAPFSGLATFEWKELNLHATDDPELVVGMAEGRSVTVDGKPYENSYFFTFRIRGGRIVEYREYFNPLVLMEALAGD